jgi:hypothetical protein
VRLDPKPWALEYAGVRVVYVWVHLMSLGESSRLSIP